LRRFALLFLIAALFPGMLVARRIRIIYRGNVPEVTLRINGKNRGNLQRRESRIVHVVRRFVRVTLFRGRMRYTRRIFVPKRRIRTLIMRRPYFRGVVLRLEGRYEWARVYINGRRRGRVYRDRPRYISLRPGRVYRIQAIRRAFIRGRYRVRIARYGRRAVRRLSFEF